MIKILCTNKLKSGPELEIIQKFLKKIRWPIELIEFQSKQNAPSQIIQDEAAFFSKNISTNTTIILLDELGQNLKSIEIAELIQTSYNHSKKLCFMIGGANGVAPKIRKKANMIISFGKATWPHLLCRIMLVEQIYRAQCILNHHPYHREGHLS